VNQVWTLPVVDLDLIWEILLPLTIGCREHDDKTIVGSSKSNKANHVRNPSPLSSLSLSLICTPLYWRTWPARFDELSTIFHRHTIKWLTLAGHMQQNRNWSKNQVLQACSCCTNSCCWHSCKIRIIYA